MRVKALGIIISVLASTVFGLLSYQFSDELAINEALAISFSIVLALVGVAVALLLEQSDSTFRVAQHLEKVALRTDQLYQLDHALNAAGRHIEELRQNLARRSEFLSKLGNETLIYYLSKIRNEANGFSMEGEYWALKSYEIFWFNICQMQEERKANGEEPMIARITHSSAIDIWLPDRQPFAEMLLLLQRRFTKADGIIIRILVGEGVENDDYKRARALMEGIGIEVKYVSAQNDNRIYDFLWFKDEGFVVKWYRGVGVLLDRVVITDAPDPEIQEHWRLLASRAEVTESRIKSIPKDREFW